MGEFPQHKITVPAERPSRRPENDGYPATTAVTNRAGPVADMISNSNPDNAPSAFGQTSEDVVSR